MAAALASGRAAAATAAAASSTPRPRVAVIGAGYAGLAAALALQRSGACDVTVLEAGQRPGGRACTQRMEGSSPAAWFESGATWFHGLGTPEEPNPVFQHALELGLIGSSPEGARASRWRAADAAAAAAAAAAASPARLLWLAVCSCLMSANVAC